jgi:beta-mannosidase
MADAEQPGGWQVAATAPGAAADPAALEGLPLEWVSAMVPGTVAQALAAAGVWSLEQARDFDAQDWWYRGSFAAGARALRFDGLATLAQVWLNGTLILESRNMFEAHRVEIEALLQSPNELVLCFRSLQTALAARRPRPRWKTRLVRQQQLRWFRTTLLGRIPGWSPPLAPVGPWRAITLDNGVVVNVDVRPFVDGEDGVVEFSCRVTGESAGGTLTVGEETVPLRFEGGELRGELRIANVRRWWPHTHGQPVLYAAAADVDVDGVRQSLDLGGLGFRTLEVVQDDGDFELRVNGVPVFCRGACWTASDLVAPTPRANGTTQTLTLLRDAGGNMVRIGGTMVYEDEAFYTLCDRLGILVWQDFMFANMDYPADDPSFAASVESESTQLLRRLRRHVSVAVYCGNSEVEQQAAMLGMPRELWRNHLFAETLPALQARWHPGTVYVPSSPFGGTLPFHTSTGVTHYYGVGAYLRPLDDARRAGVRFTSECLGFANVPSREVIDEIMQGDVPVTHDPRWKARTPRDTGAGWDFEDVRDHYLQELFGVDAARLRQTDPTRYLELSRVTTGEVMAQVFAEWRSTRSTCRGGLVWFLQDLWPGAGWGILDAHGLPKACFSALRRVWQPRTVVLTDEGLDGIHAHVLNEGPEPLAATLELTLWRDGNVRVGQATAGVEVGPHASAVFEAEALLGGFHDTAYAYRFGPPRHELLAATLSTPEGAVLAEAFHFIVKREPARATKVPVIATARAAGESGWDVRVEAESFLYAAHVDAPGFLADDDYFHLLPGRAKTIRLTPLAANRKPEAYLEALNLGEAVRVAIDG